MLEKTLESPLHQSLDWCREIKPINPKGKQFIGRTDAEAEAPILWPPDGRSQLVGKTLMLGKIEGGRRRGRQEMRRLDSITDPMDVNEQTLGDGGAGGSLTCCSPRGCKELDVT